jgi:putative heme iron utilization protein
MMSEPDTSNAGVQTRFLLRRISRAALATTMEDGTPYVSLVEFATDGGGSPVLLLSELAQHTMNLHRSPAVSLLLDGTGGDTLDGPRATVLGSVRPSADPLVRARYLARHPQAARYADFADFSFWRMEVHRAHLVAGFGRIAWVESGDILLPESAWTPLADAESRIVSHMNEDHSDAISLYATELKKAAPGDWRMTCIDPEGFDIADGWQRLRLTFDNFIHSSDEARAALVDLVKQARRASSS